MNSLHDMVIDEVSLVDIPANQHSSVEIAKRAHPEETHMAGNDTGDQPEVIDLEQAEPGDIIVLEDGTQHTLTAEDIEQLQADVADYANQGQEVGVGKAFTPLAPAAPSAVSALADEVRQELSKALTDADRDAVISKMAGRLAAAETAATKAAEVAKALADERLEGKYTEVAKSYAIPGVDPEALGPVLKRFAETASEADQQVLAKALASAGATFREIGSGAVGNPADPMAAVADALAHTDLAAIGKAFDGLTVEQTVTKAFEMNPGAYDAFLAEQQG